MTELATIAPAFVEMAHRIVWCTVATVDPTGQPRTRVLHPIWKWNNDQLTGWVATSPLSPKADHLAAESRVSLTYWEPGHDTCTADCTTAWEADAEQRARGWNRFAEAPEPVGYDPSMVPSWTSPDAEEFGILRLEPSALRVMPGTLMATGQGTLMQWRA